MANDKEFSIFLKNLEQIIDVRIRLVTEHQNNKLEDYITEAPPILASYMYNRFYQLQLPTELKNGKTCHVKHSIGIENIYIGLNESVFISIGPFTSGFLSVDEIEERLIDADLTLSPSLYRFFAKELPMISESKLKAALSLVFQFFAVPVEQQKVIPYYIPGKAKTIPTSAVLTDITEHEKMIYRHAQTLAIAEAVSNGDYAKCLELLKSTLQYQSSVLYSDDERTNEQIIAFHIGTVFYYAAIKGGATPLDAEHIFTKHVHQLLNADSTDSVRTINRAMMRAFCDAAKQAQEKKYSGTIQKVTNYISLLGGEELDINEISRIFKSPIFLLSKEFKKETGVTLKQYHRNTRLQKAAILLAETNLPISQIAMQVGFYDQNYFSRQFRAHYKCTPSQYRQNIH